VADAGRPGPGAAGGPAGASELPRVDAGMGPAGSVGEVPVAGAAGVGVPVAGAAGVEVPVAGAAGAEVPVAAGGSRGRGG